MSDKSDAQLDAEAAGKVREPYHCWICNPSGQSKDDRHDRLDVAARLRCHRWAYTVDCYVPRLVARQPPTLFDFEIMDFRTEDGAGIGMSASGPIIRRLESPGAMYPWTSAFFALRNNCRRNHPDHRSGDRPYWRGRLCWEAVRLTVIGGEKARPDGPLSLEDAAQVLRIDRITDLLLTAWDDLERDMKRVETKAEIRAREQIGHGPGAVPAPEWRHHAPSDEHIAECPNPICRERRAAA